MPNTLNNHFITSKVLDLLVALIRFVVGLTRQLLLLLLGTTEETENNKATENAAQGGILNYRTGQFDDGTDATGWYEKD